MKLQRKIFITGEIKALTGLHIGGAKGALDIGGVDLAVIKNPKNEPFIPGSSLKGKLRSMLAREQGSMDVKSDNATIKAIFGTSADESNASDEDDSKAMSITRLLVRDASFSHFENEDDMDTDLMETNHTEVKWENTIDRKTGTAGNPRQLERVPAGAIFNFELVYSVFEGDETEKYLKKIVQAMEMLEDDYLGGHGSRGYGQICFKDVKFRKRTTEDYEQGKAATTDEVLKEKYAARFKG